MLYVETREQRYAKLLAGLVYLRVCDTADHPSHGNASWHYNFPAL